MTETTQEERRQIRQELYAHSPHPMKVAIGRAVNDADRLAQIERQVIYRTADMPEWATDWEKEDSFCRWTNYWDDNLADIAPDLRPGSALPIRLPIINPPEDT